MTSGIQITTVTVVPTITPIPLPSSGIKPPSGNTSLHFSSAGTPGLSLTGLPLQPSFLPTGPSSIASSPQPSSILPPLPVNSTIALIPTGPTAPPVSPISGLPSVPSNASSPTSGVSLPTGNLVLDSCPQKNGSIYTELGQTFEILCYTNFIGPSDQGFYVPSFYQCVHDCAIINVGFSQTRCFAASYIPNNGVGSDCFFRTYNNSQNPIYDPKATSAILLNNTVSSNITYSATGSLSIPSLFLPTATPNVESRLPSVNTSWTPMNSTVYA